MERVKVEISALPSHELRRTLNSELKDVHDEIRRDWQSVIERLVDTPTPSALSTPGTRFNEGIQQRAKRIDDHGRRRGYSLARLEKERRQHHEMARRLKKELAYVEFRISQGLDRCDQFFDDEQLLKCRHSRSKSLYLDRYHFKAPLDIYSRALKGNDDVIHIDFYCYSDQEYAWFAETIRDMPSLTSIWVNNDPQRLPPIQRDTPLFINDYDHSQSLNTFLNNNQSLARTRDTFVFMQYTLRSWTIAVSFIGPSSGNLRLRLNHRARRPDITLTVLSTSFTLTILESITIDDINLHPDGSSSSLLSFTPNIRNNLILQTSSLKDSDYYTLRDLQLLDEHGNPYHGQHSQPIIPAIEFDTRSTPDNRKSN
jgi:hypothetical protein